MTARAGTAVEPAFSLTGEPLPTGRFTIEASAGTGKTFTLAALAARFIAEEGVPAAELLMVTFTRAAANELRARVRARLVQTAARLEATGAGAALEPGRGEHDELVEYLARAGPDRDLCLERLRQAVTDFDAATINTIHGFAQQVLGTLGSAARTDPDAALVDNTAELCVEACADVLAAASAGPRPAADLPDLSALNKATGDALNCGSVTIAPGPGQAPSSPQSETLAALVGQAVDLMEARRRRSATRSFNDLLADLRSALRAGVGSGAATLLQGRYRVAMIDEFQDTDPVQWEIFEALFGAVQPGRCLVLVGDPKQAIYSFRGANLHTYLEAVRGPGVARRSLRTNWRSDGAAVGALNILLGGTTFGDATIRYVTAEASPDHEGLRLRREGEAVPALSVRLAQGPGLPRGQKGVEVLTPDAARAVNRDLVAHVRHLLETARIPEAEPGSDGAAGAGTDRSVRPSDIAVLVRTGRQQTAVQRALVAQGVPAVLTGGLNVLNSPAATQWRWLLSAVQRPSDPSRARLFALSWFTGWEPARVADGDSEALAGLQERLVHWAGILGTHGVADFVRTVRTESGVAARVLARAGGDRDITDLDHVGELLGAGAGPAGIAGMLAVLDSPPEKEQDTERGGDVAARRIESDAEAVQVMTIWGSKGLEFPIVCVPTMWQQLSNQAPVVYRDTTTGQRTLALSRGADWPDAAGSRARGAQAKAEQVGENLRLLYVALTRARYHTAVWWARAQNSDCTGLARVMFARSADGVIDEAEFTAPKVTLPASTVDALAPLVATHPGRIEVVEVDRGAAPGPAWHDPATVPVPSVLDTATLDRPLDRGANRWSFTAITGRAAPASDPADETGSDGGARDEGDPTDGDGDGDGDEGDADSAGGGDEGDADSAGGGDGTADTPDPGTGPMTALGGGAPFGTFVHSVLESLDFGAADLDAATRAAVDALLARHPVDLTPRGSPPGPAATAEGRELLVRGLVAALETPLGPLAGDRRLRDIDQADQLRELSFDLLLAPVGHRPSDREVGGLIATHLDPAHPLRPWAAGVADGMFGLDLAGHLTGSIDLVLRLPGGGGPRFVVVDYKTNTLTRWGRAPRATDYGPGPMADAMAQHHYPLQALLYAVALHRYLRWRLPAYEPARHLGGAAYLFLRGMTGGGPAVGGVPATGVFSWAIPPGLITGLSDLLAGGGTGR